MVFYVLDEYILFCMLCWRGFYEEICEFLELSVCDYFFVVECEYLELLIWWDDYCDLCIKEVDFLVE